MSDIDLGAFCRFEGLSNLTPREVLLHAPDKLLLVGRADRPQARASLWWSQVPVYGNERIGLIGHYAALNAPSGLAVLQESCRVLAEQGCSLAIGPMDGSTWRRYRLLTERGSEPPFLLEPDNPDDWPQHFEQAGFTSLACYYSSICDDNASATDCGSLKETLEQEGYTFRSFASADAAAELERLWQLSCAGFRDNFLYVLIARAEFLEMYLPLLPRVRPELIQLAFRGTVPVAFCLAFPNLLQSMHGRQIDTVIIKSLATLDEHRGKGLAAVMLARINQTARALGMPRTIHALMHEDNPSRRIAQGQMRDFRRYTLFARPL